MRDLATSGTGFLTGRQGRALAVSVPFALVLSSPVSIGHAEVSLTPDPAARVGTIPADLSALGTETSDASMACWQNGKEIFSADAFNTVLLGGLAGESAITLKNNTNGAQALAISLDNGLCFVTIAP